MLARAHNIAGYLENPWSSWVWHTPGIRRTLVFDDVFLVRVDQCQYGQPWKKPTGLLFWGVKAADLEHVRVCRPRGRRCSSSGRNHLKLRGKLGGTFRTSHATGYPWSLARAIHKVFTST
jgi:hypothetical protein